MESNLFMTLCETIAIRETKRINLIDIRTIGIDGIGFKTRFYFVNFMIDWLIVNKDVFNAVVRVDTAHHMNGVSYRFCKTSTIVEMLEDILNTIIFYLIDIRKHVVKNNMPFVHVNEAKKNYTEKNAIFTCCQQIEIVKYLSMIKDFSRRFIITF